MKNYYCIIIPIVFCHRMILNVAYYINYNHYHIALLSFTHLTQSNTYTEPIERGK